jgi:hypothetical protein
VEGFSVIAAAGRVSGVERPDAFSGGGVVEEGAAGDVRASRAFSWCGGAVGEFGLPPGPDFSFDAVTVGAVLQQTVDAECLCCGGA